jgi:hypothetical protein
MGFNSGFKGLKPYENYAKCNDARETLGWQVIIRDVHKNRSRSVGDGIVIRAYVQLITLKPYEK